MTDQQTQQSEPATDHEDETMETDQAIEETAEEATASEEVTEAAEQKTPAEKRAELEENARSLYRQVTALREERDRIKERIDDSGITRERDTAKEANEILEMELYNYDLTAGDYGMGKISEADLKKKKAEVEKARKRAEEAQERADQEAATERGYQARLEKIEQDLGDQKNGGAEFELAVAFNKLSKFLEHEHKQRVIEAAEPLQNAVAELNAIIMLRKNYGGNQLETLFTRVTLEELRHFLTKPLDRTFDYGAAPDDKAAVLKINHDRALGDALLNEILNGGGETKEGGKDAK